MGKNIAAVIREEGMIEGALKQQREDLSPICTFPRGLATNNDLLVAGIDGRRINCAEGSILTEVTDTDTETTTGQRESMSDSGGIKKGRTHGSAGVFFVWYGCGVVK
jgi:hypothetical protein